MLNLYHTFESESRLCVTGGMRQEIGAQETTVSPSTFTSSAFPDHLSLFPIDIQVRTDSSADSVCWCERGRGNELSGYS